MHISQDVLKQNYEAYSTPELVDLYVNSELTDIDRSVLSECLSARGEQLHILDRQKANQSTYIKDEVKKGQYSLYNFRRWSTWLAFLVGFPLCLFLQMHGWKVGFAIMVTILPSWLVFYIIEYYMTKRKDELKRRSLPQERT